MAKNLTEDAVRDLARDILGLVDSDVARAGVGQLTTFNQLGFAGVADKPDGWYLPNNKAEVALVLETKATRIALGKAQVDEVLKNVRIVQTQYEKVVGVLYNGEDVRVFKGEEEVKTPDKLQHVGYYLSLYTVDSIDKERIYQLTARINNCLVFIHIGDAAAGVCHYVNADFVGMKGKTSCAYNDHINEAIGLFLASVITANNASRYSFSQSWTGKSLLDTEILLPATPSGDPDWDYMDEYMSGVMEEAKASLENMGKVEKELHSADISGWKRFTIGSLFEIEKGTRLTRAAMIDGDTPFIGATLENNGITARVGNTGHVHPGGLMTVAYNGQKATGKAFYQPIPFWASDDVNVLYPKFSLTENIALFLAPLFWEAGRPYSFGDKWGKDVMENDCLVLPVNASSDPDWAYVDEYMRDVMERAQSDLSTMQSIG